MLQSGTLREDQDEASPSVESENQDERIAARRLRITARNETRKRKERGDVFHEKEEIKEELRKSLQQVERSERHMVKLQSDGTELVTNVQVAADDRESQRRTELEEARRLRHERLEHEARSSLEKFEEITQKWTVAKMKEIPQDLRDALNSQQQLCALLIDSKNKLINELQQELKASDDRYVKDLKKQAEEVDLMIERMEDQIKCLMRAYREELDQIESSYDDERRGLLTANRKKWDQQMQERRDNELENLLQRMKRVEECEVLLQRLRVEDAEECNMIKIKLETEVQLLEQQLQQVKATCQLNQEKLEYNFQVLKRRDEENTITKSQQKRKITRLQDALKNQKTKCANQEKQSREENQSLTDAYRRVMQQYKHMQKKMRHFVAIDAKRYEEVWLMNEAEAKAEVQRALETDRMIHEQQLGLAWVSPPLAFMERSGPLLPQSQPHASALQAAARAWQTGQDRQGAEGPAAEHSASTQSSGSGVDGRTVKRILELLCDETGFLIESKMLKLLSPLDKDEQSLMKLVSIFTAMGIENDEDVYKMADFFVKYRQQQKEQEQVGGASGHMEEGGEASSDLIHPNDVVLALRAFTAQHCRPIDSQAVKQRSALGLEERDDSEDAAYWESMANVIPESRLKIWTALETALHKYHSVLTERSKLLVDTQNLKQQNAELKMLLHQYINSSVNSELEIPPTHVTQMAQQ